jgi:WD40 repeat protein
LEAATGKAIGPPLHHGNEVHALAFTPDGRTLVSGSWDGTARLWPVPAAARGDLAAVRQWLQVATGQRFDAGGGVVELDVNAWDEQFRRSRPSPDPWGQ